MLVPVQPDPVQSNCHYHNQETQLADAGRPAESDSEPQPVTVTATGTGIVPVPSTHQEIPAACLEWDNCSTAQRLLLAGMPVSQPASCCSAPPPPGALDLRSGLLNKHWSSAFRKNPFSRRLAVDEQVVVVVVASVGTASDMKMHLLNNLHY